MERIGRYELVAEIGRGGMGAVYEARDPELERKVAIKVLNREHANLFRDEARALAALNHPGIVTIHEVGEHEGRPYLVMELLRGRPLRDLIQHHDPGSPRERLVEICAQVAVALAEAHARGILHRDIKPENVVVLGAGGVKVVDFGIARRLDDPTTLAPVPDERGAERASRIVSAFARTLPVDVTPGAKPTSLPTEPGSGETTVASLASSTQTVFGTPAYMAPEILAGEPSSPATDIYSLGVMLYECLAGRRPYDAPRLVDVVAMVLDGTEPPPLADPLAPLVARMMARDPRQRPSAREVAAALVPRPGTPRATARRVRVLAGVVALAVVLGIAGWRLVSSSSPAPAASSTAEPIAVAPFEVSYRTYGDQPWRISDVLGQVLAAIEGIRIVAPSQLDLDEPTATEREEVARRLGARFLVTGKLVERDGIVTAELELLDLVWFGRQRVTATAPVARNAALVVELANGVARRVLTGAKLDPADRIALARKLYEVGIAHLNARHWDSARPYLEQAVEADPTSARSWDALASARGWTLAPQPLIEEAIAHALADTSSGPRRTILQGAQHYFRHEYEAAVTALEPLASAPAVSTEDAIDVAYYLGEALWHAGEYARGAAHLQRVYEARPHYEPATIHLMQHAIAHRDVKRAGVLIGNLRRSQRDFEMMAGEYEAVANSGEFPLALHAQLILDRTPTPALEVRIPGFDRPAYEIARALVGGDTVTARREAAAAMQQIAKEPVTDRLLYNIGGLVDVLASSGLREETAAMLAFLRAGSSPRYAIAYRRTAHLAAPLLGAPPPTDAAGTTPRERKLAAAITAELARDHREAARLLTELVADPGDTWNFGERIALVRNLRALGDKKQLAAQCADIAKPPLFRYDFLLARKACQVR